VSTVGDASIASRNPVAETESRSAYGRKEGEVLGFKINKREPAAETESRSAYGRNEGEVLGFKINKREAAAEAEAEKRGECGPNPHAVC
jgi:hypothetical protein